MRVRWGSYYWDAGACQVGVRQVADLNAAQIPYQYRVTVDVRGRLYASGQTAISLAENAMRRALLRQYQDFIVYQDDGNASSITFLNRDAVGGNTIAAGPNFTSTYGADFVTFREFDFSMNTVIPIRNAVTALTAFEESLEAYGGAPEYVHKRAINAPPQKQLAWFLTEYVLVQTGQAVGYAAYPTPPPPLFPLAMKTAPRVTRRSPQRLGNAYINYPVSWQYVYESAAPLVALPNVWR